MSKLNKFHGGEMERCPECGTYDPKTCRTCGACISGVGLKCQGFDGECEKCYSSNTSDIHGDDDPSSDDTPWEDHLEGSDIDHEDDDHEDDDHDDHEDDDHDDDSDDDDED